MCGIAGIIDVRGSDEALQRARLQRMLERIAHRGPDDSGLWTEGPVALGHRRLAIVDLSPMGHQPMLSACGRYVLVYNGEVYNHGRLRAQLESAGTRFKGHSDTEVLLALIARDGLAAALRLCVGMFAIALWDRQLRQLQLARDRFGEKPLYFGWCAGTLLFGSELKALRAHDRFDTTLDAATACAVLQRGYAAADRSIHRSIQQVAPATCVTIPLGAGAADISVERYWDPVAIVEHGRQHSYTGGFEDAVDELQRILLDAVSMQLQADVPVGSFLSGGVDSSVVTALMVQSARTRVNSYAIGFHLDSHNEAEHAKAVATHLGTKHTEWYVSEEEAQQVVPTLSRYYDEPLADASQIPTLALARLVRKDVTVALSGDGADEVLGGYPKYCRGDALWAARSHRKAVAAQVADARIAPLARRLLPSRLAARVPWHRLNTAAALYGASSAQEVAKLLGTMNRHAEQFLAPAMRDHALSATPELPDFSSYRRSAMLDDVLNYLPGDILTKVDRATMSVGLEARAPLLDHRVFEWAATLPDDYLFDARGGKRVLRALLYRLVPQKLVDRPKSGFSAPLANWLRGGLRCWAYDVINSAAATHTLDVPRCKALLDLHCQGHHDLSARVWPIVTLAAWLHEQRATAS